MLHEFQAAMRILFQPCLNISPEGPSRAVHQQDDLLFAVLPEQFQQTLLAGHFSWILDEFSSALLLLEYILQAHLL